jgi:hypothetical protein
MHNGCGLQDASPGCLPIDVSHPAASFDGPSESGQLESVGISAPTRGPVHATAACRLERLIDQYVRPPSYRSSHDGSRMTQIARHFIDIGDGCLRGKRDLILDRDTKYSDGFRKVLVREGVHVFDCRQNHLICMSRPNLCSIRSRPRPVNVGFPRVLPAHNFLQSMEKFHQSRLLAPRPLRSGSLLDSAGIERTRLGFQIDLGADVGSIERHVSEPPPDCVDIDARAKQMRGCRMATVS